MPSLDSACLDDETIALWLDGSLPAARREAIEAHLDGCDACRRLVGASAQAGDEKSGPAPREEEDSKSARPLSLRRGATLGRYLIVDVVGAGGMGIVYGAWDPDLDRKVALKVLRPDLSGATAYIRREAQAMARLSHPNVVAAYDVGTALGRVFVAMEFVDGRTAADWLAAEKPDWRTALATFSAAGQGLAAAHAAGIVHRDFKPQNVLIGRDGRVRVTDFGLARTGESPSVAAPLGGAGRDASVANENLAGTPGYMAPEQLDGGPIDARTDIFAFCVSLYEALYGERPFAVDEDDEIDRNAGTPPMSPGRLRKGSPRTPAKSSEEARRRRTDPRALLDEVRAGRVRPPTKANVPTWLRQAVLRGLRADPEARYPSMEALLEALARDPAITRRRVLVGLGVTATVVSGIVAGVLAMRARPDPLAVCRDAPERFNGIWDNGRRRAIHDAFSATKLAYAEDAWRGVERAFDEFATDWVDVYRRSCEAGALGTQANATAWLRMACLQQELVEVQARSDLFAAADAQVVENAVAMARTLDEPLRCERSGGAVQPSPDATQRPEVERVRRKLAEASALEQAGRYEDGLSVARAAVAAAEKLGWRPVIAEARYRLGVLLDSAGDYDAAEPALLDAAFAAEASGHDRVAAQVYRDLVILAGDRRAQFDRGLEYGRQAQAVIDRIGGDERLQRRLFNSLGDIQMRMGRVQEAVETERRAIAISEKLGEDDREFAWEMNDLGNAYFMANRFDEAAAAYRRSAEVKERMLGPNHPDLAISLSNLGSLLTFIGRYDEAAKALARAREIHARTLGMQHRQGGVIEINLGDLALATRDWTGAMTHYQAALEILLKSLPPRHSHCIDARLGIGRALVELGRPREALESLEMALKGRSDGTATPFYRGEARFALARALGESGADRKRARELAEAARSDFATLENTQGAVQVAAVDKWLASGAGRSPAHKR